MLVPVVDLPADDPTRRLFECRTVLVSGPLDHGAVNLLSAKLMALDGESERDVELFINSDGGPLGEVSALLDVVELMRAKVNVTCIGSARGTAAALLACGSGERRAAPNAIISLRCSSAETIQGPVGEVRQRAEELATARHRLQQALVSATGLAEEVVGAELEGGAAYDATGAKELGIIDAVLLPPRRR